MVAKVGADQLPIPFPVVFGVSRGMDSHVAIAPLDVPLKSGLLIVVQDIPSRAEADHHLIVGKVLIRKKTRVLGCIHVETILCTELGDRSDSVGNRVMPETG